MAKRTQDFSVFTPILNIENRTTINSRFGIGSAKSACMKNSIFNTSFFRRLIGDDPRKTYWGRLGSRLVESDNQVIVYDPRGVLHSSDSVEEATEFYARKKVDGKIAAGGIYMHYKQEWQRVSEGEIQVVAH
jgi:hypothetical protein